VAAGIVAAVTTAPTSTDGQPLGQRGLRTRQRILEAIAGSIEREGLRGIRLADVAAQVGFSPPAFYQYFDDLDEAILALCEEVGQQLPTLAFPEQEWQDDEGSTQSTREFVVRFFEYWNVHRAVLHSRNVALIAGDERFRNVRDETFAPMLESLLNRIRAGQRAGRVDPWVSPSSVGVALTVMLDRMAMLAPQIVETWGHEDQDELIDGLTCIFDRVLGVEVKASTDDG
jgi:AcrR family transcriptional regulator